MEKILLFMFNNYSSKLLTFIFFCWIIYNYSKYKLRHIMISFQYVSFVLELFRGRCHLLSPLYPLRVSTVPSIHLVNLSWFKPSHFLCEFSPFSGFICTEWSDQIQFESIDPSVLGWVVRDREWETEVLAPRLPLTPCLTLGSFLSFSNGGAQLNDL